MHARIDLKLCAQLAVIFITGGVGIHLAHIFQGYRHADALLAEARRAGENGQLTQSLSYLKRYLDHRPDDLDALIEYGIALDRRATTAKERRQALATLEKVSARAPRRLEVRRLLVRIAFQLARFEEAESHLRVLLDATPDDGECEHLLGHCCEAKGEYSRAASWFEKAIRHFPGQIASYVRLAEVLERRLNRAGRALQVLDQMVSANPQSAEAYLIRANFYRTKGAPKQVLDDLGRARQLAPTNPGVLLASAELLAGNLDTLRSDLQRGLKEYPRNPALYIAMAELELRANKAEAASQCLYDGLRVLSGHTDLQQMLCEVLLRQGKLTEAAAVISTLRNGGSLAARSGYWDARLLMCRGKWLDAARILELARQELAGQRSWALQTDLALGQCFENLGDFARQAEICRRAVAIDGSSAPARAGLASALMFLGKIREAVAEYRQVVQLPNPPEDSWTALARALIVRNRQLTPSECDWDEVEHILHKAAEAPGQATTVTLLRAEALQAQHENFRARELLEKARAQEPRQVRYWIALADFSEREGQLATALQILDQAHLHVGDAVVLRLARMRYLSRRGGVAAAQALAQLERDLPTFRSSERTCLLRELARLYYDQGNYDVAYRFAKTLSAAQPDDLGSWLLLFELSLGKSDEAVLRKQLEQIRRIEGEPGVQWRLGEIALLLRSSKSVRSSRIQARAALAEIIRQRPNWARPVLLQAYLDELDGKQNQAIEDYNSALELGERQANVIQRVAQLLYERRRYVEADRAMSKLEQEAPLRGTVAKLAVEIALANHNSERAVRCAHQAVAPGSRDYRDHLWLSHVLEKAGDQTGAEKTLKAAVTTFSHLSETWLALVQYLARTGQLARAQAAIRDMTVRFSRRQAALPLGRCYEAVGQPSLAEQHYRDALEADPDDPVILRTLADFYLRSEQSSKAETHLRRIMDPVLATSDQEAVWARRQLAFLLAKKENEASFREALGLIDMEGNTASDSAGRQCALARLLATRQDRRPEAIRLLVGSRAYAPLAPEDQFLLAQLYEATSQRARAREQLLDLVSTYDDKPAYLAFYVDCLRRWGEITEARRWLIKLEKMAPDARRTAELKTALDKR